MSAVSVTMYASRDEEQDWMQAVSSRSAWRKSPRTSTSAQTDVPALVDSSTATLGFAGRAIDLWTADHLWQQLLLRLARQAREAPVPVSDQAVVRAIRALTFLVFDNAPTPQLAIGHDGSIEIEWLINGDALILAIERDGESQLWAELSDGSEAFSGPTELARGELNGALLTRAARYLADLAPGIRARAWHAAR